MVDTAATPGQQGLEGRAGGEVTRLLEQWRGGDSRALEKLTSLVYQELRRLAYHVMRSERREHTLQPTALVHEAFLRLSNGGGVHLQDQRHFFAIAARVMRRVLVEHARRRTADRRGGGAHRIELSGDLLTEDGRPVEVLAVHQALERLESQDPRRAQVVELRYFCGFTLEETAAALGVTQATVVRDWRLARAFLECELNAGGAGRGHRPG